MECDSLHMKLLFCEYILVLTRNQRGLNLRPYIADLSFNSAALASAKIQQFRRDRISGAAKELSSEKDLA